VFKLLSVTKNEFDNLVVLTYVQIVGEFTAASDLIEDILVAEGAPDRDISLGAFFTSAVVSGNTNPALVTETLIGLELNLSFAPDQNGTSTITLLGTLTNGEVVEISFLVTVDSINDAPFFSIINDPALVLDTAGEQTVSVLGLVPGPGTAGDETGQTVTLSAIVFSETAAGVITGLNVNNINKTISYTPASAGEAVIAVVADDGQNLNATFTRLFTVTVGPETVVVPNNAILVEGDKFAGTPFVNLGDTTAVRWQQRYPASEFTELGGLTTKITQIAFRPEGPGGGIFSGATFTGIEIDLATISSQIALVSAFDSNLPSGTVQRVYDGTLVLSTLNTVVDTPRKAFDIVIVLQTPFVYDPAAGDLVMEIRIPTGGGSSTVVSPIDAVSAGPAGFGGLEQTINIGSLTIPQLISTATASTPRLGGPVTQFTFEPVP